MIKKVIAAISALALSLSAFVGTVSAVDISEIEHGSLWPTMGNGITTEGVDEYGSQYFTFYVDTLKTNALSSADVAIKVPAGVLDSTEVGITEKPTNGLQYGSGRNAKYPNYGVSITPDGGGGVYDIAGDGYDTLAVSIYGGYNYLSTDGLLFEVWVTPTDPTVDVELTLQCLKLTITDYDETVYVKSDTRYDPSILNTTTYVIGAGTSIVTEKKDVVGPNDPIDNYIGDETTDGDNEKTSDQSKAWGLSIDKVEGKTYVYKLYEGSTPKYKKAADLVNDDSLTGNIKVGLILTYDPSDSAFAAIDGATIEVDE